MGKTRKMGMQKCEACDGTGGNLMTNKPRRSPTLKEYMEQGADDSNAFWRLESGDRQNLLDEAIEEIVQLKEQLAVSRELRAQDHRREIAMNKVIVALKSYRTWCPTHEGATRDAWEEVEYELDALAELDKEVKL